MKRIFTLSRTIDRSHSSITGTISMTTEQWIKESFLSQTWDKTNSGRGIDSLWDLCINIVDLPLYANKSIHTKGDSCATNMTD